MMLTSSTPPSGLASEKISQVLNTIYRSSLLDDQVIADAQRKVAGWRRSPTTAEMSALAADAALPVAPDVGRLLYTLVRAKRPNLVVEFGSSLGASLVYLAAGIRDNRRGRVVGTELHDDKRRKAMKHLRTAELDRFVDILAGDALQTLATLNEAVDILLLDGWKGLYLPVLELMLPRLQPGSIVVSDNVSMLPEDYLNRVRDEAGPFVSVSLPLGDGLELSTFR